MKKITQKKKKKLEVFLKFWDVAEFDSKTTKKKHKKTRIENKNEKKTEEKNLPGTPLDWKK